MIYNYADTRQSLRVHTWAAWYRLQLWSNFTFYLNNPVNGGGFHSNDARVVVQNTSKPLARYWGGEVGLRTRLVDKVEFSAAYWRSDLSNELVFVGDEGTFEPSGSSRRQGIESEIRYDILPWLSYDLDVSYTWAKFTEVKPSRP